MPEKSLGVSGCPGINRGKATYKIETVNVCLVNPLLKAVGHLRRRANKNGPVATYCNMLSNSVLGPL